MKRSALLLALVAASAVALAEAPPGDPPRGPPIERIAKDLNLNTNQTTEVKRILEAQRERMDMERQHFEASGTRPSREEMQAKHEQMGAELRQQLSGVLTAEQLAKCEEMRKHQRHGPPPGERPDGEPPQ
ncbi:MAG: hypothetical protein ABI821_15040 [Pseudomonadota bacterium]